MLTTLLAPVWAGGPPMPTLENGQLRWPAVAARTINVHRGDGSHVESLPGDTTSWTASMSGDYYLVAADRGDWRDWPRSDTVTVIASTAAGEAPAPTVEGDSLRWPAVSAYRINVHRSDGSYVTTLPGSATSWRAPAPGGYYLVATDFFVDWPDWPRSDTVIVAGAAPMPTVLGDTLTWPAVPGTGINVHRGDGSYVLTLSAGTISWTAFEPGDYYLVATNEGRWPDWPRSDTVTVAGHAIDPTIRVDNRDEILRGVVSLINAEALDAGRARIDDLADELVRMARDVRAGNAPAGGLTLVSEEEVVDGVSGGDRRFTIQTYGCHAGGSLVIVLHERADAPAEPRDVRFHGCAIETDLLDGGFLSVEERPGTRRDVLDALSVTSLADGPRLSIDGRWRGANVPAGGGPDVTEIEWIDIDAELPIDSGVTRLSGFRSFLDGYVALDSLSPVIGVVLLPDGSTPAVRVVHVSSADMTATFTVTAPWSGERPLSVRVELSHDDSYFDWANPDTAPDYPLTDLGSPLTIMGASGSDETFTVESLPREGTPPVQWEDGEIVVAAEDGSRVTLRPVANDPARVEIRLNGADEPVLRAWSEGFQVRCPENFASGCGR